MSVTNGHAPGTYVPRDPAAERRLLDLAAAAAGFTPAPGERHRVPVTLELAGRPRALLSPQGGPADLIWLPPGRDLIGEARDELIDAGAHYLLWEAVRCEPALTIGDHERIDRYDRSMRALAGVLTAWNALT